MASRTGEEGEDKIFKSPEGVRQSSVFPAAMSFGEKVDAFGLVEELDVEGCIVLERSTFPCIAQVVTGEVVGIRRPSVVI